MSHLSDAEMAEAVPKSTAGPVSKRKAKRVQERRINSKANELDDNLKQMIKKGTEELNIPAAQLSQRVAIVSPPAEKRKPMWWNGVMAEQAEALKGEYSGPGKGYLAWVATQVKEDDRFKNLSEKEKAHYAEIAERKRTENKEAKTARITRKKMIEAAAEKVDAIHADLEALNLQVGFEFTLFVTRCSVDDQFGPYYVSSKKANEFMQGQMKLPAKELATLLDLSTIGGVGSATGFIKNQKETLRTSVRTKLCASYCRVLESEGHDISNFCHIKYSSYGGEIVLKFRIVLRGYPLASDGNIIHPSDFPGGIKGLAHADKQLSSGHWGFEKISDGKYEDFKLRCDEAEADGKPMPFPPHISVPGSEYTKTATKKHEAKANSTSQASGKAVAKKRKTENTSKTPVKSRDIIDDDSDDDDTWEAVKDKEPNPPGSTTDDSEESEGSTDGETDDE
ncbi:hypothetical protein FRC12_005051 [Ceratobasidium sp. 428]|nr:hypothetical protein FRC12_005051 [Ceratobasidium sp. 428]